MNAVTIVEAVSNYVSISQVATTAPVCKATLYRVTRNLAKVLCKAIGMKNESRLPLFLSDCICTGADLQEGVGVHTLPPPP